MTGAVRAVGSLALIVLLLGSALASGAFPPPETRSPGTSAVQPAAYSGVTGYVYADTNNYAPTVPLSGATVTVYDACVSLATMSCTFVATTTTDSTGFFGLNLAAGSGYYAVVAPDASPEPLAPHGFGGAVQGFTAPDVSPLEFAVYPLEPYGNATLVLPGYNCLAAYVDNFGGGGPGCDTPVLSWTQDGAYYVNTTNVLVFYSFVNRTVYPICDWTPLYQGFPSYAMIPNELFSTQDGSYLYSWGEFNSSSGVVTVEAVNVTTHRVFVYNYTGVSISDVMQNGAVQLTGWDGNDSQAVLVISSGEMIDHDLWEGGQSVVGGLPFFEANNIYWMPDLNSFINVEAGGSSSDYVEQLQLTGPVASSSAYSLAQTYLAQWTTVGITVNGVNGISFNVSSRELSVQAENSGLVYSVYPDGKLANLLVVTNLNADGACACVSIGAVSESDRPALAASGPDLSMSYNGYVNDSWLTNMVPGHIGLYSTNVSPYNYNAHASFGTAYTWLPWFQEGQFVNASYGIAQTSDGCDSFIAGPCPINGGGGAAVGTIWWMWKLGLPEFPYPASNPSADANAPAVTDVTSVAAGAMNATVEWTPLTHDAILNYTVAWGTQRGAPTEFASALGSAHSYTITGLAPSTTYYVTVQAWNLHYHGGSGGVSSFATLPEATGLAVTGVGVSYVSLAWSNPLSGTFTNLTVEYGTSPGALSSHQSVGVLSSYTVNGLRPSTRYYFAVVAWNGSVEGVPSNIVNATTSFQGPTFLHTMGVNPSSVLLVWTNPAAGTFTNISVDYGTAPSRLVQELSVGVVGQYTVSGLRESTTYYFEVIAWNGSIASVPSNIINATTPFQGPADLLASGPTTTSVYLSWLNPPAGTFTNLTVEYGPAVGSLIEHASVGTVSYYTVTGLAPARTYYFEVIAWNFSTESLPSTIVSATTLGPGATGLVAAATSSTNVHLAWSNPPAGTFTSLGVEYGTAPGALFSNLNVGTQTSCNVSSFQPATTYYFEVVAFNGTVAAEPSNLASATTWIAGVTDLVVTGTTTANVTLSWTNPRSGTFSNLTVEYGTNAASLHEHVSIGTVSAYTVVGLAPSTPYYFEVVAWNGSTQGAPSNVVSATTATPSGSGGGGLSAGELELVEIAAVALAVVALAVVLLRRRRPTRPPEAP